MKKIITILFLALVISQYAFSQFYVGGSLSYQNSKFHISNNTDETEMFGITLSLGYRLGYFELGGLFIYQTETDTSDLSRIETTGFGAFSNYSYYIISSELYYVAARVSLQYINSKIDVNYDYKFPLRDSYTVSQNSISIKVSPVFDYSLTKYISLYTAIGSVSFSYYWGEYSSFDIPNSKVKFTGNSLGLSLSTEIALGIGILLF